MTLEIRKKALYVEDTLIEGGKVASKPLKMIAAAAVIRNPWAGKGFVEDLKTEILKIAPPLAEQLSQEIVRVAGSGATVEAYGKGAMVGTAGEIEHAAGIIHTLRFGNHFRKAVGAKSYLSFTNVRGGPGASLAVPLMHKDDAGMRSHYLTIQFSVMDAPAPDEILVALGASIGGRPHHRIGNRYEDLKELGGTDVV
jgi:hypothetical protein